ncbi:MAG: hypothetical protein DRJ20_02745, partial [Candidatus Methanomethylicota archaeon]
NVTIVDLSLEPTFESDKAILRFHGEIEGNFRKAFACAAEPEVPQQIVLPDEFYERLRQIQHAELDYFALNLTVSRSDGTLRLDCKQKITGDVERQFNEVKNLCIDFIEDLAPNATSQFYTFCRTVLRETHVSAKVMDFTLTYTRQGTRGILEFCFEGLKLKPPSETTVDAFKFYSLFDNLAEAIPEGIADVTFVIEGGSSESELIEIIVPPHVHVAEKTRHRVTFKGINFNELKDLAFKVVRNAWGVADANIHEIEELIAGKKRKIIAITNSTLRRFQFLVDRIELEVEGPEGTIGALNMTIPKEAVSGVIVVYIDKSIVTPTISMNATHYFVFVKYTHSIHTIQVKWGIPQLSLAVSSNKVHVGESITFTGSLSFEGTPITGVDVSLYINDEPVESTVTNINGEYSFTYAFMNEGTYECKVVCETYEVESEVQTIKVSAPPSPPVMLYGLAIVAVVIILVAAVLMLRRKS